MTAITIRRAQPSDLPQLSDIWYEKMVVQQQLDQRFTLAQAARQKWLEYATLCLVDIQCVLWVAEHNTQLAGYMIACLQDSPPGLLPEKIACITDVALDIHNPQPGLGQQLLLAARSWFAEQDVQIIIVHVPHRQVVDQAFWRAQGATEWMDLMWLKL
jgi:Acetyltransferase (GNAT) family